MEKYGYITKEVKDSLQKTELDLRFTPQITVDGTATYFREYLRSWMKDWTKDKAIESQMVRNIILIVMV